MKTTKRGSSKKSSVEMERKRSSSVGRMSTTIDVIRASTKFLSHQSEDTAKHYGKVRHVKILPSVVKHKMAKEELNAIKRKQTIGKKWNSAMIFSVIWSVYCICLLLYFAVDPDGCSYWFFYFFLRCTLLIPTYYLAYCWRIGFWPEHYPNPEWIGVIIASYVAVISTLAFAASLNETCGEKVRLADDTIWVKLTDGNSMFQTRRGECNVYGMDSTSGDYTEYLGKCEANLVDRRTHFEKNVFAWTGQLVLYLFAFTSLFKPSFRATLYYTLIVWCIGFLGCWYQGFEFWEDTDRVYASGVGTAIFLFMSAALVNIFSAKVLKKMEQELVNANYELTANMLKRQKQPSGEKVVYLETDLQSSTKLWEHHTDVMHKAIKVHHNLMRSLALEYFGWELATEGDAFLLAFHDVYDAVSFALTFQNELMEQDWHTELLGDVDAIVEFVKIGSDERENYERAKKNGAVKKSSDGNGLELVSFRGPRVRMAIHMGTSEGGIKGSSCRFVHHLTDLAWGGMILLSDTVSQELQGTLDQLAKSKNESTQERLGATHNVPRMVCMGMHSFEDYTTAVELFHIFNEPLRGRHIMWDDKNLKLRDSQQHTLGFYDAPVNREGIPETAVIVFADIEYANSIQKYNPGTFSNAVLQIHRAMGPLLLKHKGYKIVPQREGHFMMAFKNPLDVARFHSDLQQALISLRWPTAYSSLSYTKPIHADPVSLNILLFNGLTVSLGMSVGRVNKTLESGRASYTGPTCNRAARVTSCARSGQLLMFEHEYNEYKELFQSADPNPIPAEILYKEISLKGVQGKPNIVWLDTNELTKKRHESNLRRRGIDNQKSSMGIGSAIGLSL